MTDRAGRCPADVVGGCSDRDLLIDPLSDAVNPSITLFPLIFYENNGVRFARIYLESVVYFISYIRIIVFL